MLKKLLQEIRIYLNDVDRIEYSDEELITYCNDALEFIEDMLAMLHSSINLEHIEVTDTPYEIPYSLLKIDKIEKDKRQKLIYKERTVNVDSNEYSIVGDKIYVSDKDLPVDLYFHTKLERFTGIKDEGTGEYIEELDIYYPLVGVIKQYATIKALARLEYTSKEEDTKIKELETLLQDIILKRDGLVSINRYSGNYSGWCRR